MAIDYKNKTMGKLLVNFANSTTPEQAKKDIDKRIKKLYYKNKNVVNITFDDSYEEKREGLKNLLNEIININDLGESKLIKKYINNYNKSCTSQKILNGKGKIITKNFLRSLDYVSYDKILTFIIIHFFMNFEVNKQYIHRCKFRDCQKYFISIQKGSHITTCRRCRNRSTLTQAEQHEKHEERKLNKYRNKIRLYIINQLIQKRDEKSIELQFDDDQLKKWLKNSKWSVEGAITATKYSVTVKNYIVKQLDNNYEINFIEQEFENNADLKELLDKSNLTFKEAIKFSKPETGKKETDKSV